MDKLIVGTTPTIKFTFKIVNTSDITVAVMTIKQGGVVKVTKTLADATVGTGFIAWTLAQTETLALDIDSAQVMCNWKKADGTRGASDELGIMCADNQVKEVI